MKSKKNSKKKSMIKFAIIIVILCIIGSAAVLGINSPNGNYRIKSYGEQIKKGLDLQGGTEVLLQVQGTSSSTDSSKDSPTDSSDITSKESMVDLINRTKQLIENRLNPDGLAEITVTTEGSNRIRVAIPGQFDTADAVSKLTQTGDLTFSDPDGNVLLSGQDVKSAAFGLDQDQKPQVQLKFNEAGTEKFKDATTKFLNQAITIKMDDEVVSSPTVDSTITNGDAVINNITSVEDAQRIASMIQSGALPVKLGVESTNTIGSTLGKNALPLSVAAGGLGIALIFVFMLALYRKAGVMADVALAIYVLLTLFVFNFLGVVLTLPGIAAFILTVGMAVDANILIFERVKEELLLGKTLKNATTIGTKKAMSSIVDSNLTTIVSGIVLYTFGTGDVKGFAITLIIGVVCSMFTATIVTHYFLNLALDMEFITKAKDYGTNSLKKGETNV